METYIKNDDYYYLWRIDEDAEKMFMSLFETFFSIAYDGGDGNALFICKNYKVDDVAELFYNNYLLGLQQFKKDSIRTVKKQSEIGYYLGQASFVFKQIEDNDCWNDITIKI